MIVAQKNGRWDFIWPLLTVFYFGIDLIVRNRYEVPSKEWALVFIFVSAIALITYQGLKGILKDPLKAGFAASLFLYLFFTFDNLFGYGPVYLWLRNNLIIWRYWTIIPALGISGVIFLKKLSGISQKQTLQLLRAEQIILAALYSSLLFQTVLNRPTYREPLFDQPSISNQKPKQCPNIYLIILDAYAREDTLKGYLGFDNHPFIENLEKKGFFVAHASCSNYPCTILSIPSFFSMHYLQKEGYNPRFYFEKSPLRLFLKEEGYSFVNIVNGEVFTSQVPGFDLVYSSRWTGFLTATLINKTMLGVILKHCFDYWEGFLRYHVVQDQCALLEKTTTLSSPHFVFCHILCPHDPFVFAADGSLRLYSTHIPKQAYLEQLSCLNKLILKTLDHILAKDPDGLIVLQADHGSRLAEGPSAGIKGEENRIKERFSILNAYYFPTNDKPVIPDDVTPVNSFRLILNHYFGTSFSLLKNYCDWTGDLCREKDFAQIYTSEEINAIRFTSCLQEVA